MGNYMGTFLSPFIDIPPSGKMAHMRYHEYFKFEDGKVVEIQAIWDLPELMMQSNAWPMAPQLGAYLCTPGPMGCDGLTISGDGSKGYEHIINMLTDLCSHPANPDPKTMNLEKYWHPRFNWYGPAGIGTGRGVSGFRNWHQIPFLGGMPDRTLDSQSDRTSDWGNRHLALDSRRRLHLRNRLAEYAPFSNRRRLDGHCPSRQRRAYAQP